MMNTAKQTLDFSNCWVFDRLITDEVFSVEPVQEIEFDWQEDFGLYEDFQGVNRQFPGFATISFCFVATRNFILC
jgi:hypothetical protein